MKKGPARDLLSLRPVCTGRIFFCNKKAVPEKERLELYNDRLFHNVFCRNFCGGIFISNDDDVCMVLKN